MLKKTRFLALGFVAFLAVSKDASAECIQTVEIRNATEDRRDFSLACGTRSSSNFSLEPDETHTYTCKWSHSCGGDTGIFISFAPSSRPGVQRKHYQLYDQMTYNFGKIGNDVDLFPMVWSR
ncbi:hypothetical protein QHF89_47810 [Polyangium sorediatum]|uniref:S-protein homolog n=1 Tax=Polyangium sorediatum TaxID=889274 RepID=A0ABT6P9L1_9BACT|nr:hypothetical protein [Polyangium sorediatum]